jgi:hypothetical protein
MACAAPAAAPQVVTRYAALAQIAGVKSRRWAARPEAYLSRHCLKAGSRCAEVVASQPTGAYSNF